MKEQFTNVKVGDRVWSINYGWGEVTGWHGPNITVRFGKTLRDYSTQGFHKYMGHIAPSLFWDEIDIIPPARPKREVIHEIERWVNVYPTCIGAEYTTEERAKENAADSRIACVRLTGTYTTWEED